MIRQRTPQDQVPEVAAALDELDVETLRDMLAHETDPALAWLEQVALDRKEKAT